MKNIICMVVIIGSFFSFGVEWDTWGLSCRKNGILWHFAVKDKQAYIQSAEMDYDELLPSHVIVPESLEYYRTYKVVSLEDGVFANYDGSSNSVSIERVKLPPSLKTIGGSCFFNCHNLTNVEFNSGLLSIGYMAFHGCSSLTNVEFNSGLLSIGSMAFGGCSSLTNVSLPSTVTTIGAKCFINCSSLRNIDLPNSVSDIGANAFDGCVMLESLNYPSSLIVDSQTFIGNHLWEEAVFPEGVKSFSVNGCTNLKILVLPSTIESAGENPSRGCRNIKKVVFHSSPFSLLDIENSFLPDLLRRSDSVFYKVEHSNDWERVLCNSGYGGKRVSFIGMWPNITTAMINGKPIGYIEPSNAVTNCVCTIVTNDVEYALSSKFENRTIANVDLNADSAIDFFVLRDGKVFDCALRIVNTSDKVVNISLPAGYVYEKFSNTKPLEIPALSTNILTITRTDEKTFLIAREELTVEGK